MTARRRARRFLVVGGGCFGARFARSLVRARARGECGEAEIWVIDRDPRCAAATPARLPGLRIVAADWEEFFADYLGPAAHSAPAREEDLLVPSPLAPHLFTRWLARALSREARLVEIAPPFLPDTPLARPMGPRLAVSFADWRCPVRCVEPAVCPATRQPRTWDVPRALVSYARALRAAGVAPLVGPLGGRVTHLVQGVGVHPLMDWAHAARRVRAALATRRTQPWAHVLAATTSGCHGVATLLRATRCDPGGEGGPGPERV